MQKKVTDAKNKKAPNKGASNVAKKESIFNYDVEVQSKKSNNKAKKQGKRKNDFSFDDKYLDTKEVPKISKKNLNKIKKKKKREKLQKEKDIRKQEIKEEKERIKKRKRRNPKTIEKRKKSLKIIEVLFLIVIIIAAILLFLLSPIFKINNIQVKGNEKIPTNEIISLSTIEKGTNLFRVNKRDTIKKIKQNAYVESVTINRKILDTIEINIKERKTAYMLEYKGSYAYIDNNGYILEISSTELEGIPKLKGYKTIEENIKSGNRLETEDVDNLKVISKILDVAENYEIKQYISSIDFEDNSHYILYLKSENKTVYLGDTSNLDIKMLYMQSIIEKEKDKTGTLHLNVDFKNKYPYASWM